MATNENLIPIPGRLHSVASEGHVSGADEIYDDTQQKDQETINSELIQAVGTGGSVDSRIAAAVNVEKTRAEGAESTLTTNLGNEVTRATNAENALDGRVDTLEDAVGTGGSVDSRISAAVATETSRAQGAESNLSSGKADKATTLAGYGITDAYTKSETYTKTEVNGLVSTPHQEYVTVADYASLPASGSTDTIYRVSNYDGTQVATGVYSEYAWNGTQYVFLAAKSSVDEVFDITVYNNNTKYADLAAALGVDGANVPADVRRGGMSIKFVRTDDNKYVQYRLMSQNWSTKESDWQDLNNMPVSEKGSVADLDVCDGDGNVVMQLKEGHIKTRNFNSKDIKQNVVIVDVNGNGKYTTITEASASEPANTVFLIMPGVYDDENVQGCDIKKQHFIGLDRDSTIVKNHQNGNNNCVFTIGAGSLENLTIIKEWNDSAVVEANSYAVHADSVLMSNETLFINNCFIKSDNWACAVGMGMKGGCHVTFKDSYFIATRNTSPAAYAHDNYREEAVYDGIQTWTMIDCVFYSPNCQEAIGFQSMCHANSIYNIEMIRTRLKSLNTQKPYWIRNIGETEPTEQDFLGLVNGRLIETSWGNSCSDFNND